MGIRGVLCFFALALVFFDLAACEDKRRADELLLDNQFYSALGEINGHLVEYLVLLSFYISSIIHICNLLQFLFVCVFK